MSTFFQHLLELDRVERVARVLAMQTEAYGYLDVPTLADALRPYAPGSVLDIGTGEGSFLFELAQQLPGMQYLGLDSNAALLAHAQARLQALALPTVRLEHGIFDAHYADQHEVIVARFTLQHVPAPSAFLRAVYRALKPGGLFACIEPVYDYFGSTAEETLWEAFRERMMATYERWGSYPHLPRQICPWLAEAGFSDIRAAVHIYSPLTLGHERFATVILATATMLHAECPDLWDTAYLERLAAWLQHPTAVPFLSIAHIRGVKSSTPAL